MPTLRQLEYVVAVAEHGSFTRAAAALHVSQPALSHQIAALERESGGPLFDRLARSVRLTPAGRELLPHARAALHQANGATAAARRASGASGGELHIGAVYSVTLGVLLSPLRIWRRRHPAVQLRLSEFRHGDRMAEAMQRGDLDLAIGPRPPNWSGRTDLLGDEQLVVLLPRNDPAATRRGSIDLRRLVDRGWVHYAPGHGLAEILDAACARAGYEPQVAVRVEQTATAPLLASSGLGPALVPASIVPRNFDGEVLRTSPSTSRPLTVSFHEGGDPLTIAFAQTVARHAILMPPHVERLIERTRSAR